MTLVVDASVLVAATVDAGRVGNWAADLLVTADLAAPHLILVESASALRRLVRTGAVSSDAASDAHDEMLDLAIDLYDYAPFARRIWQLRETVTPYDAWYVAVAEAAEAPLATVDQSLGRAPGPRCELVVPES